MIANCANASRKGSITEEIYSSCVDSGHTVKTGFKETKKAGLTAVATAELSHEGEYEIVQEDKLISAFEILGERGKGKKSVIVLDNVETIFGSSQLMGELSDIIILLDDSRYAQHNVKFLIVGVPNEVINYFSSAKNTSSVGNRIEEVPRVTGLDYPQVRELVERGFGKYLKINLTDTQTRRLSRHVFDITLGVPQRIHEYCECLAYKVEDNSWKYNPELLEEADIAWLLKGLRECYTVINGHLNSDETSDGRRNQVIYAIGKVATHQIDTNKIGELIAKEFPESSPESKSGIGQVLGHLSKGSNPVLKKISNSNAYSLADPRFLMCIRIMLFIDEDTGKVRKKAFRLN